VGEVRPPTALVRSAVPDIKTSCELECTQRWRRPSTSIPVILGTEASIAEITNKYPKAASVVQQVCKMLSDIELLAGYTPAKVGERSRWEASF
jgi:hypothetical protein